MMVMHAPISNCLDVFILILCHCLVFAELSLHMIAEPVVCKAVLVNI